MIYHNNLKYKFDPYNIKDLQIAKNFLKTHQWGSKGCPFQLEWPHLTIPDMLVDKIVETIVEAQ